MGKHTCPTCGEDFRMAWIGFDPPEPYGDVCGCPDDELTWARDDKAATDAPALLSLQNGESSND